MMRTRSFATFPAAPIATDSYAIPLLRPEKWMEEASEGELAVDVHETSDAFVVQTAIAGIRPEDLSLAIHRDLLTIRGERARCAVSAGARALVEECHWGKFSRTILLPEPVHVAGATAALEHGILTITLPKLVERTSIAIDART